MISNSVYYFNSGTSWVVPAGVTGIQVECFGSSYGFNQQSGIQRGNYPGGSYSKSNVINVTGGSTVYMNIGSLGGNTWFNTTNTAPTSASSTSSACLAVGGNTASASQIAANCGDVKYRGGNGLSVSGSNSTASGGQAGPNGNGADVVSQYTNTPIPNGSGYESIQYSGGGANGGSSGSLGVPPYGRSGSGTAGSGAYWNGTSVISQAGTLYGGFMDVVGQYSFINNNLASTLTNYGPVGGGIVNLNVFTCFETSDLQSQAGFIVITLLFGRKYQILTDSGTWELPADWNDADNVIEAYGPGGNGATSGATSFSGGGGGGGGYVKALNVPLKALDLLGTVVTAKTYTVAVGTGAGSGLWQGYKYLDEFDNPFYGTLIIGGGGQNASANSGGFGGFGDAQINNVDYATTAATGGTGGNGRSATTGAGGGGGGAAGPNANGGAGGTNTSTLGTTGRGGGGGNGGTNGSSVSATGGTAGTGAGAGGNGGAANTSGSAGGAGTSVYSGGGGGGAGDGTSGTSGGAGGLYGGGGGGSGSATSSVGGAGRPGIIIISYNPIVTTTNSNFFMFF